MGRGVEEGGIRPHPPGTTTARSASRSSPTRSTNNASTAKSTLCTHDSPEVCSARAALEHGESASCTSTTLPGTYTQANTALERVLRPREGEGWCTPPPPSSLIRTVIRADDALSAPWEAVRWGSTRREGWCRGRVGLCF
ncbi:hypothetical protein K523DRAFT_119884 [Schizophyllum commune Tattone D]|nr:hypothetical protein K523DRAFT_119884 [Schizophyllum commune Tattone D]